MRILQFTFPSRGSKKLSDVCLYPEIGCGVFEGACASSNTTANFSDPPPPIRESTFATPVGARLNEGNFSLASSLCETFTVDLHTPHRHRRHPGSAGRSDLARTPSGPLRGYRSLRSRGCCLPHSQGWPIETPLGIQARSRSIPLLSHCSDRSAGKALRQRAPADLYSPLLPPFGPCGSAPDTSRWAGRSQPTCSPGRGVDEGESVTCSSRSAPHASIRELTQVHNRDSA